MYRQKLSKGRDAAWDIAIVVSTVAALALNGIGLLMGITVVLPHLLYIPVVIGSYRHPRLGPFFALGIGLAYCSMVFLSHGAGGTLAEAAVRATVLAIIGWLIAYLSARLHEREELYRGVFDNSEAGMLVVAKTGEGAVIQEANWNAARLTGRGNTPIQGALLSTCLGEDLAADIFIQLEKRGGFMEKRFRWSALTARPSMRSYRQSSCRGTGQRSPSWTSQNG